MKFFLSLFVLSFLWLFGNAQTVIFQSGFEAGDPAFTYDATSGTCSNVTVGPPRTGTNNGRLLGASADGSIMTPLISFTAGKYYTVEVYSKATKCVQSLSIKKSLTATNAAMKAATGADIILAGSNNVTATTYTYFSAVFLGTTETKYVGFQMINGGCGGAGTSTQDIDDIKITQYDYAPCGYYCKTGYATALTSYISNLDFNTISRPSGWDGYICTGLMTTVQRTSNYNFNLTYHNQTTSQKIVSAWIDYNQNGLFTDAGEQILIPVDVTTTAPPKDSTISRLINIPATAVLGITKMRVAMIIGTVAQMGPCTDPATIQSDYEDYDIEIAPAPSPMTYVSSTVTQNNISPVNAGTFKNEVIGIQVVTTGTLTPLIASSLTFATTGTTNALADISSAKLWYTSNSAVFSTATQVGTAIANPNGTFTINTTQTLIQGTNYFWLTYDIPNTATAPDVVDAVCTSINLGSNYIPTVTAPVGNRPIITATPMVYISSTVTQNVSRTPRPDLNHQIIGIEIVTSGAATPLVASTFNFNTTGTTAVVTNNIANARLWYTGTNNGFSTTNQVGTVVASPNGVFTISPNTTLYNGTNYFWLTYDILATAGCDPTQVDAQCPSIIIGGVSKVPTVTSPLGAVVIDCNTAYYSLGSLPANLPSSWNSKRDGTGVAATSFATTSMFYIQSGHTMTTSAAVTIPYLTVEAGGYIKASQLVSCTDLRINSYGTFEQIVQATNGAYITNFFIENYGTWIHNNAGFLPNGNRYFSPRSNQWFYQWGGGTFPSNTSWGNVLLNGTTTGNFGMGNCLTTIQGDFEWRRIGNNNYLMDEQNETINIGGNLIFSGGWWKIAYDNSAVGNQSRVVTVNVAGDLIVSAGKLEDYIRGDAGSAAIINVNGNVNLTGGTVNLNLSPGGLTNLNLTVGNPISTWSQTGGSITLSNTNVKAGKTVNMIGNLIGNVAATRTFTVETNAKLMCSNFPVSGAGNFTLQTGAWLGVGSAAGITSTGLTGNIQVTGTRSYNTGATYEYYEGLSPQSSGNFLTTTTSALYPSQVTNLIINKTNATNVVALTNTTDVLSTLTLTKGVLQTSFNAALAPWVRIPSTGTVSPIGGSPLSYVDGYIRKQGATSFIFPTGNAGKWRRIEVSAPSISTEFEARYITTPFSNTLTMSPTPVTVLDHVSKIEHWMLNKPLGADAATTKVKLYWEDAAVSGIYKFDSLSIGRWSGAGWENTNCYTGCPANWTTSTVQRTYTGLASSNGAGTVQSNTTSLFGPFTFSSVGIPMLNPLPVTLLSYTGNCNGGVKKLKWSTASEHYNDYYTIEKSTNGYVYTSIGQVDGQGNSNTISNYSFDDVELNNKPVYYKLSQTDFNGNKEELGVISLSCKEGTNNWLAYLNSNNQLAIAANYANEEILTVQVYDMQGKVKWDGLVQVHEGFSENTSDISSLAAGIYIVRVTDSQGVLSQRLLKK
ncbi:MAG: BNR-repeat neuraminidase N-terminal domain-containing protein [Bacteroidota bacterium]